MIVFLTLCFYRLWPNIADFVEKTDFDDKLKNLNKENNSNSLTLENNKKKLVTRSVQKYHLKK